MILERLQGGAGIPNLIWHNTNGDFYFLVRELLGNCLEEYLDICNGKFSLKTTLMIGDKILSCIQQVHLKGIIHKDITPSNFLVGLGRKLHQIYAIDFAQSATYEDAVSNSHLPDAVNDN